MTVTDLRDRAKLHASNEVIILAHELVSRAETDPTDAAVSQIARRIHETAERLATLT